MSPARKSKLMLLVLTLWLLAIGGGLRQMLAYKGSPGAGAVAPVTWPADSQIRRQINPHAGCVCTSQMPVLSRHHR